MSRKLIYVSGLLACYRCHLDYDLAERLRVPAPSTPSYPSATAPTPSTS